MWATQTHLNERRFRRAKIYARTIRISLTIFIISSLFSFIIVIRAGPSPQPNALRPLSELLALAPVLAVCVSFLAFIVSALGTASTIMLGWRSERRQTQEFHLKIQQLELQLAEARAKAASEAPPSTAQASPN